MEDSHHKYTGLLLMLFTVLILAGALCFTIGQVRVANTAAYKAGDINLQNAKNYLIWAYVLSYIAGGMGIVLAILYFSHVALESPSEWPHMFIFGLSAFIVAISGVFAITAINKINSSLATDKGGSQGWLWAGFISLIIGFVVLLISGIWRSGHFFIPEGTTTTTSTSTSTISPSASSPSASSPSASSPSASSPSASSPSASSSSSKVTEKTYNYQQV